MAKVHLVDIGVGNIGSVSRCLERLNVRYELVGPDHFPDGSCPLVLPGVGSFGAIMAALGRNGFQEELSDLLKSGVPYLGLCVGLQILFESSEENPTVPGLGLLPGKVVKFTEGKVPQIGWNQIRCNPGKPLWPSGYVYFVNSYVAEPEHHSDILYEAEYYRTFCAAVQRENLTAFQFHPEKSGEFGHELIQRWVDDVLLGGWSG